MGLITPPGMEEYRGFFRMLMLVVVAAFAYMNFSSPASRQQKQQEKEAAKPEETAVAVPQKNTEEDQPLPAGMGASSMFPSLDRWTNDKIKKMADTAEGKILVNALAQIAIERKAGVKDLTLFLTESTGRADYRDLNAGTGTRAECGANITLHTDISNHNRTTVMNTEKMGAPLAPRIGDNSILPGIERLIPGMRVGGKRIIGIPPALAYDHPSFHNSLVRPGQSVFATVTMVSAEKTPRAARDTVSEMPRITPQAEHTPLLCGMRAKAVFYKGKNTNIPLGGVATPVFTLGQPDEDIPPIALHAMLHSQMHGIADTYTAVKNTPTAAYINTLLYPTAPQDEPVFTVTLYKPATPENNDAYDFLGDDFELPVELEAQ